MNDKLSNLIDRDWLLESNTDVEVTQPDSVAKLTKDDKKLLLDLVSKYKKYQETISNFNDTNIVEVASDINKMINMAENYVLSEQGKDWFDGVTVTRNFKNLKQLSEQFNKSANEVRVLQQRSAGLYEEIGMLLSRYFEV